MTSSTSTTFEIDKDSLIRMRDDAKVQLDEAVKNDYGSREYWHGYHEAICRIIHLHYLESIEALRLDTDFHKEILVLNKRYRVGYNRQVEFKNLGAVSFYDGCLKAVEDTLTAGEE